MPTGWYAGTDPLNISRKQTQTAMRFDWKMAYSSINLPMQELLLNGGNLAVSSLLTSKMQQTEMSLRESIGDSLFGDGTGYDGKEIIGLKQAVHDSGVYGTINRSTTEGAKLVSYVDAAGGTISLAQIQKAYGRASLMPEAPDLIITTQGQFDTIWGLVQANQRFTRADGMLGEVGFPGIMFNNATIVVDQSCPAGEMYLLNTKWMKMLFHSQRTFSLEGPFPIAEQDVKVWRLHVMMALIVQAPRLCSKIINLTEPS